jgi:hypothetical protein
MSPSWSAGARVRRKRWAVYGAEFFAPENFARTSTCCVAHGARAATIASPKQRNKAIVGTDPPDPLAGFRFRSRADASATHRDRMLLLK